jgi:ABC-type uncharacterized transport system involved in gliding motility auxiliary subunit
MRRPTVVLGVAALAAIIAVNVLAARSTTQVDLSEDRRFSLSGETRDVVREVRAPLRITAFVFERGGVARDVRFLLDRYHELNDRIDYRIVDPDEQPAEAQRYKISGYSTVVVEYEGKRADAPEVSEIQVSSAILRVLRGDAKGICALQGHGEPSFEDDSEKGLSLARDLLATNGYVVRSVDLTAGGAVPTDCAVVLEVGPTVALAPAEVTALVDYAKRQGRLLVLGDSALDSDADLNPLLEPWGIAISQAIALDPQRSVQQDPLAIVVQSFPSANPIVRSVPSIELLIPTGLLTTSDASKGLTVSNLAATSNAGFLDVDQGFSRSNPDIGGPITVAAAADASRVNGTMIERTRVVAVANSHWLSNGFLDRLGNRRLLVNSMLWLTEEEQLLTVGAATPRPRELPWTTERQQVVVALTIVAVPGAVLGLGMLQWWFGRRVRATSSSGRPARDRKKLR